MREKRGKPRSCGSVRRRKKLPDWRKRPENRRRLEPVGVEEREPAEARAEPDAAAPAAACELVERARERARVGRRGGVGLEPVVGSHERDAVRRYAPRRRRGRGAAGGARPAGRTPDRRAPRGAGPARPASPARRCGGAASDPRRPILPPRAQGVSFRTRLHQPINGATDRLTDRRVGTSDRGRSSDRRC